MLKSVRWLIATAVVVLVFALAWSISASVYDLGEATSLEIAAVAAAACGLPLSWWTFRGQLLDEPAEVAWVTWRRVPAPPATALTRQGDQDRLDAVFGGKGRSGTAVITGAPGAGKTELVAGYARARISESWPLVAWINAGTHEEMLAGLLEFADALSLRVPEEGSARACERLRLHPPTGTQPSVIVFDGVVDVDTARPYLPTAAGWRVLVTSSAPDAAQLGTEVAVEVLPAADAAARTGLAEDVCEALAGLPAALAVAAATIREGGRDQDYPDRLRGVAVGELLGDGHDGAGRDESYPDGAAAAILLALGDVGFDTDPAIRRLLGLLTVLSPGGVARGVLYQGDDPSWVDELLDRLTRWSLLSTRLDSDGVLLPELTRRVVTDRLRADPADAALPSAITDAADLLGRVTFGEEQAWDRRGEGDLLVAHIAALSTGAGSVSSSLSAEAAERVLGLRHWATRQLSAVGDGARATEMAESTRTECETLLGPDHPDTLVAADNLVIAYTASGRASDGIGLAEETLAARERVLGEEHPDTLASRYSLAYAHEYAGQLDEALPLYDNAYTEYARVLGADHPQTSTVGAALTRVRHARPQARVGRHRPDPQG